MEGKSSHAAQYDKSRASTKVLKSISDIESFGQQYFIIKGLLQSEQLEKHMVDIRVYK